MQAEVPQIHWAAEQGRNFSGLWQKEKTVSEIMWFNYWEHFYTLTSLALNTATVFSQGEKITWLFYKYHYMSMRRHI